jgi:hypothetical protein
MEENVVDLTIEEEEEEEDEQQMDVRPPPVPRVGNPRIVQIAGKRVAVVRGGSSDMSLTFNCTSNSIVLEQYRYPFRKDTLTR